MFDNDQYSTHYTNQPVAFHNPLYANQPVAFHNPLYANQPVSFPNPLYVNQSVIYPDSYDVHQLVPVYTPTPNILSNNETYIVSQNQQQYDNFTSVIMPDSDIDKNIDDTHNTNIDDDSEKRMSKCISLFVTVSVAAMISTIAYFTSKGFHII